MLYDGNNKPKGMVGYMIDITAKKTAENLAEKHAEELAAVNRELEAFSYSVSHDLRAPLRSIDGFSLALLEDYADNLDDTGMDYLRRVRTGTQRMGHLIDDLLKLSRVTSGKINLEKIQLSKLAEDILDNFKQNEPQHQVEIDIQPDLRAYADLGLIRVALENLLGNAWKYSANQPNAQIQFGCVKQDHQRVYYVRDNGVGFDMQYATKLFGAFQRLHKAGEFEGSGIGLATVQRIIHRHGGKIWAQSEPDKGATFYFTLPATA
jgi:light-regulated signal transduction histidine kinase (bacteriophytochrome)